MRRRIHAFHMRRIHACHMCIRTRDLPCCLRGKCFLRLWWLNRLCCETWECSECCECCECRECCETCECCLTCLCLIQKQVSRFPLPHTCECCLTCCGLILCQHCFSLVSGVCLVSVVCGARSRECCLLCSLSVSLLTCSLSAWFLTCSLPHTHTQRRYVVVIHVNVVVIHVNVTYDM